MVMVRLVSSDGPDWWRPNVAGKPCGLRLLLRLSWRLINFVEAGGLLA